MDNVTATIATTSVVTPQLIQYGLIAVFAILGGVWAALKVWLQAHNNSDVKNDKVRAILDFMLDRANVIVTGLQQELADDLRAAAADGKLTTEEKIMLKAKAIKIVMDSLTPQQLLTIKNSLGEEQINNVLGNIIEAALKNVKASYPKETSNKNLNG